MESCCPSPIPASEYAISSSSCFRLSASIAPFARNRPPLASTLVFIEEPEAHLHPQMQEVFIRQVSRIAQQLSVQEGVSLPWPVQFIVSTHSSHVANAAGFEAIRYSSRPPSVASAIPRSRTCARGCAKTSEDHRRFLHQYLTLTRATCFLPTRLY